MNKRRKKMKGYLVLSLLVNFIFIVLVSIFIMKRGGYTYIRSKLNRLVDTSSLTKSPIYLTRNSIYAGLSQEKKDIVFIGDSYIDFGEWGELFSSNKIVNRGISGEQIEGVKNRIEELISISPEKLFIMVGINDLNKGRRVQDILSDFDSLFNEIHLKIPNTEIFVHSILPTTGYIKVDNGDIVKINNALKRKADIYKYTYINLFDFFVGEKIELNESLTIDGLHINGKGYSVWKKHISAYLD